MSHQPRCERRGAADPAAELPGMGRYRMRGAPTRRYGGEYRRGRGALAPSGRRRRAPQSGRLRDVPGGGRAAPDRRGATKHRPASRVPRPRRRNPKGRSTLRWTSTVESVCCQGGPARSGFILLEGLRLRGRCRLRGGALRAAGVDDDAGAPPRFDEALAAGGAIELNDQVVDVGGLFEERGDVGL